MTATAAPTPHRAARRRRAARPGRVTAPRELGTTPTAAEVAAWAAAQLPRHARRRLLAWPTPCCRTSSREHAARRRRALPRHRLPLRRHHAHARPGRRASSTSRVVDVLPELHRRRAGRRVRRPPLRARPRRRAADAQGRAARAAPCGGYEAWVTGVRRDEATDPHQHPAGHLGRAARPGQDQPARRLDLRRAARLRRRPPACRSTCCSSDGYPSIGCEPCTQRVAPGEDPRAGRWAGLAKTECGLHP